MFYSCIQGLCVHKELFPLFGLEYAGLVCSFFLMVLSNAAGIGGGGLLIPLTIVFFGWDSKSATVMASFFNSIAAFLRFVINYKKRHPDTENKTLIDYDLVVILLPLGIFGTMIGVIFHSVLPDFLIEILFTLFLLYVTYSVLRKSIKTYK